MKKAIAMLMTLALLISALAVPALAEETAGTTNAVTSATTQVTGKGGQNRMPGQNNRNDRMPGNGQMPQTPGQNNRNGQMPGNGQMPQMPGQNSRNGQMPGNGQIPQMPGQDNQTPQLPDQNSQGDQNTQDNQTPQLPDQNSQDDQNTGTPQKPGRGMKHGRQGKGADGQNGKQMIFDQLLKDGVITQEVYDAITAWLQQNMPQAQQDTASDGGEQAPTEGTEPPALPDGTAPAEGSEPPTLPDGTAPAEGSEPPALPENAPDESVNPMEEMLKSLLDSGVITQEQYDLLLTAIQSLPQPSAAPDAPSET